jgi:flavin reductase (DIM6/NTAB) family NADH-FMN oxidoreductase RutF
MKRSLGPKTLALPLPAFLVGSYDENNNPNLMTAAWGGILSSDPPCAGVSVRPSRMTFDGVVANKAFTLSVPHRGLVAETDFCGLVSGRQHNKFQEVSLTMRESSLVSAPYVDECPLVLECKLHKTLELGSHVLLVGHILNVLAEERVLLDDVVDPLKADPLVYGTDASYYSLGERIASAFSEGKKFIKSRGEL